MFRKYFSIENSYREKFVSYALNAFPDLGSQKFILQEKIDGSNFQVIITKYEIKFGKRRALLDEKENFFDWQNAVKSLIPYFTKIQKELGSLDRGHSLRLFGELYGPGIQKRVYYGKEKGIRFFDGYLSDVLLSPSQLETLLSDYGMEKFIVPTVAIVNSLKDAMEYNEEFDSLLTPEDYNKPNFAEGFVIKPYLKTYIKNNGEVFILKKKNEKFKENDRASNSSPKREDNPLNILFLTYLNENRVLSVFSKEGKIEDESDIGKYMKLIMEDAKEDFIKDHKDKISGFDSKQMKEVFGGTSNKIVFSYLIKAIKEAI